jgi:polyhydroxyalkanoate synthesis regulator phasin
MGTVDVGGITYLYQGADLTFANKELLARYLLGELSAEDRQRLEKEYLADDEVWETLTAVEDDLIDSYVRGDLSEEQTRNFEQHFLDSPEKQERLEMAKLLMDGRIRQSIKTAPMQEQQQRVSWSGTPMELLWRRHRVLNVALGAVTLAVFVVAAVLILQNRHLRTELTQLQSNQFSLRNEIDQLQQQIASLTNTQEKNAGNTGTDQHGPETVAALLTPRLPRGTGQQNNSGILRIPATASSVVLTLQMERDPYRQYELSIETPEGNRVSHSQGLKSEAGKNGGRTVSVHLPAQLLKKGDYILTLSGQKPGNNMEVVDSYSLSVLR